MFIGRLSSFDEYFAMLFYMIFESSSYTICAMATFNQNQNNLAVFLYKSMNISVFNKVIKFFAYVHLYKLYEK